MALKEGILISPFHIQTDVLFRELLQGTFLTTATSETSYEKRCKFFKGKNIFFTSPCKASVQPVVLDGLSLGMGSSQVG